MKQCYRGAALLFLLAAALVLAGGKARAQSPAEASARYRGYATRYSALRFQVVWLALNLKLDEGNYQNVAAVDEPAGISVLVSKYYGLPPDYRPQNLMAVDEQYARGCVRLNRCSAQRPIPV